MINTKYFLILNQFVCLLFTRDEFSFLNFFVLACTPFLNLKFHFNNLWYIIFIPLSLFIHLSTFGKIVSPESAFHFLLLMSTLKFLQSKHTRDYIVLAFTQLLILAVMALLTINIISISYTIISFILLFLIITDQDAKLNLSSLKTQFFSLFKTILIMTPLFLAIFFLFPRIKTNLFNFSFNKRAEVGYNSEIKLNEVSELFLSTKDALKVFLKNSDLRAPFYIRGSVLEYNDGLNWFRKNIYQPLNLSPNEQVLYSIEYADNSLKDIFIIEPLTIPQINELYGQTNTLTFKRPNNLFQYDVSSQYFNLTESPSRRHLFYPKEKSKLFQWANSIKADSPEKLILNFKNKIQEEKFSYSLAPGRMTTLDQFLEKKVGYCNHYSALMAATFRINNIPSRIVSGFLGGQYNEFGNYYLIKMNDAHSWVEYYANNNWNRVDPTIFINAALLNPNRNFPEVLAKNKFNLGWLLKIKIFFDYLNYRTNLFLENFDKTYQEKLALLLNLKLSIFYLLLPLFLFIFLILYWLIKNYLIHQQNQDQYLINKFLSKYQLEKDWANKPHIIKNALIENEAKEDWERLEDYLFNPNTKIHFKNLKTLLKRKRSLK